MKLIINYLITYFYLFNIIILTSFIKKKYNINEELSRKFVHIMVGLSWFILIIFFNKTIHLVIVPLTFIIINFLSFKYNLINAMERNDKKSLGTIYFAISYTILSLITYLNQDFLFSYGIGALTLTLGDGLAPLIAKVFKSPNIFKTSKTYSGSLFIFISTIIIVGLFCYYFNIGYTIIDYLILGLSSVFLELIGNKGKDNLTLPLGLALLSYFLK